MELDKGSGPGLEPINADVLGTTAFELYQRARLPKATWNAATDIPWDRPVELTGRRLEVAWRVSSGSMYGEQAGLITAARLVEDVDDVAIRFALATAVSDEAKHAEVFARYAIRVGGEVAPRHPATDLMWDGLRSLDDPLGMFLVHTILEGLASDEFALLIKAFRGDLLSSIYEHVRHDENRHVAMGTHYLRGALSTVDDSRLRGLNELEDYGLQITGVEDPAFFAGLADISELPEPVIREWIVRRHRERMDRIFGRR